MVGSWGGGVCNASWRIRRFQMVSFLSFFFFQAEDGIRDYKVTGVQTCALPISEHVRRRGRQRDRDFRYLRKSAFRSGRLRANSTVAFRNPSLLPVSNLFPRNW